MPNTDSPFRYPGGKTQLYNFVLHLLEINDVHDIYIEPFAGGAGLPMKLLIENKVERVWINDYDKAIYSVWYAILHHHKRLISMINDVPFDYVSGNLINSEESIKFWDVQKDEYQKNKNHQTSIELAFATLFLNRTNNSGIIQGGPIGGRNQTGSSKIYARFNKKTLIGKINLIRSLRDRIKLTRLNALDMIPKINKGVTSANSLIFFDPPYYEQGKNLYYSSFTEDGHKELSEAILSLKKHKWITTYDKSNQITNMYSESDKRFKYEINYSANNQKRGHAPELMFASPAINIESFANVNLLDV